METFEKIDELLQGLVGQFVWGVRSGVDTFITMEFGEPHRVVGSRAVVKKILARRRISIKGDVSLFVRGFAVVDFHKGCGGQLGVRRGAYT
jgi:hypothetical protein